MVPDLQYVAFYVFTVLYELLFGIGGHIACEEKVRIAVSKTHHEAVVVHVIVIFKRAYELKPRVAQAVLHALIGHLERELRILDRFDKAQI